MFYLRIEEENIPLSDLSISVRLLNPMFTDQGSFSLSFNIPLTNPLMKKLAGKWAIDSSVNKKPKYDASIVYDGQEILSGTISFTFSRKFAKGNLNIGNGAFYNAIKDVKLTEVPFEPVQIFNTQETFRQMTQGYAFIGYPNTDWTLFPVYNEDWQKDESVFPNAVFQNEFAYHAGEDRFDQYQTIFFYLLKILNELPLIYGYTFNDDFYIRDGEFNQLVIFNTFETFSKGSAFDNVDIKVQDNLPNILIKDFLKQLDETFNTTVFVDNRSKSLYIKNNQDIIESDDSIDISDIAGKEFEVSGIEDTGILFSNGSDSGDEEWSNKFQNFYSDKYTIKDPVQYSWQLPATANINDIRLVTDEDYYYIYKYDQSSGSNSWQFFSVHNGQYKVGEAPFTQRNNATGSFVMELKPMKIYNEYGTVVDTKQIRVPVLKMKGNSAKFHGDAVDFGLRLLFYKGIKQGEDHIDYPFGSIDNTGYWGDLGSFGTHLSLKWEGEYGLYQQYWSRWAYWWLNYRKEVKRQIYWDVSHLLNFKWWKKYRIGGDEFLIKEIPLRFEGDKIVPGITKLVKI